MVSSGLLLQNMTKKVITPLPLLMVRSCSTYCKHALSYSNLHDKNWFGPEFGSQPMRFTYKTKKGKKKQGRYSKSEKALKYSKIDAVKYM
jgi:hypothetical protein